MNPLKTELNTALSQNGFHFSESIQQTIVQYLELLERWNKIFNLTAIENHHDMIYLHIIDSLLARPFLIGTRMLDVGSGAGLPGIPLAIAYPETQWVLLDKNSKKTRFLTQAIAELHLSNVVVAHSRSEDFHTAHCFDSIISRAYGSIALFLSTTEHLLCPQGVWVAMKGKYPAEELNAVPNRFTLQNVTPLNIKGMTIDRHVACFRFK